MSKKQNIKKKKNSDAADLVLNKDIKRANQRLGNE